MIALNGLVDLHCHLDLYPDHEAAILEAEAAGVFTLTVTTTPKAWQRNLELTKATRYVRAALGLHPQLVAERFHELPIWDAHLPETRYIGEVGLDAGPRYYRSFDLQKEVFAHVLCECAKAGNKVITVHSVRAAKAVLDHIEAHLPAGRGRIVLHWFTGTKSESRRAIDMGCYFSINSTMLDNERHREMVSTIPLDRILTETDGPFTKIGERPSRPSDVIITVAALGQLHNVPPNEIAVTIRNNLRRLLGEL
ncbi:TatD family hydrolase [Luteimonas sp. 8-5]|uniref:Qat anti-phage system TatD family nuclease QatD n=1 Tax=Luteimonas sp. 8-5 TaxID=3039387 RepID=UPI002436B33F|nr:Qat anti-phage system TatD family nuclease QatD [Luteimonas sp. 8-5]MDG6347615.1 TatD family hydrolase [Luteimonas sp. 8-5]